MQGQALRDSAHHFARRNCILLGASFDSPTENQAFRTAQGFDFALLSDEAHLAGAAYHVQRPDGKYADYPLRHSFLIDPGGIIRRVYDVDDVAGHAAQVLTELDQLQAS